MRFLQYLLFLALISVLVFTQEASVLEDAPEHEHIEEVPKEVGELDENNVNEHIKIADANSDNIISLEEHQNYFNKYIVQE